MAKKDNKNKGQPAQPLPNTEKITPKVEAVLPPAETVKIVPPPPTLSIADAPSEATDNMFRRLFKYIAGVALVIMSVMSFSYGISGDEQDMAEYGKKALDFYTSMGRDTGAFKMDLDKDKVFRYYGAWFDVSAAVVGKVSPLWEYDTRHLLNSWVGWLAMLFTALLVQLLAGWRGATIAFMLMFFSPSFFGHSMNNPKDIPFAMGMIMSLYTFVRLVKEMPNIQRSTVILAMLGIGLAIGSRVGGLMLFGYLGLFFGVDWLRRRKEISIGKYFIYGAIVAVGGFLVGMLFFPFGLQSPIKHTLATLAQVSKFPVAIKEIYGGDLVVSANLPLTYLPKMIFMTTPLMVWVAVATTVGLMPAVLRRVNWGLLFGTLFAFVFPLAYIIYTDANVYGGWRHVLFVYPPLVAFGAVGVEVALRLGTVRTYINKIVWGGMALLVLLSGYWYVRSHPNQYVYYNETVGGINGAYGNYELDYYFNAMRPTCEWFNRHVLDSLKPGDTVIVASNASKQLDFYYKDDKRVKIVYTNYYNRNMINWDYGVFSAKGVNPHHIQTGTFPHQGTIYTEKVGNAVLGFCIRRPSRLDMEAFEANKRNDFVTSQAKAEEYLNTIDSNDAAVRNYLSNAYLQTKQLDKAEAESRRVLALHPKHTGGYGVLGQVYMNQNKFKEAITTFRQLLNEERNTYWAHYFIAICYYNAYQNCDLAIAHFDTCISYNRGFREAYIQGENISTKCGFNAKANYYRSELAKVK
jgi:tetratricopeptide (TPR) repeat protein